MFALIPFAFSNFVIYMNIFGELSLFFCATTFFDLCLATDILGAFFSSISQMPETESNSKVSSIHDFVLHVNEEFQLIFMSNLFYVP